jgi:hypothetical protein
LADAEENGVAADDDENLVGATAGPDEGAHLAHRGLVLRVGRDHRMKAHGRRMEVALDDGAAGEGEEDEAGNEVQTWTDKLAVPTLGPGERSEFTSRFEAPPVETYRLTVTFAYPEGEGAGTPGETQVQATEAAAAPESHGAASPDVAHAEGAVAGAEDHAPGAADHAPEAGDH